MTYQRLSSEHNTSNAFPKNTKNKYQNQQGHVRIGPTVVSEPAYHVSRNEEDFVTWRDDSKIRRKVAKYNDRLDDAELL